MTALPDGYEFRLSPNHRDFAIWEPGNEPWFTPEPAMQGRWITPSDMDRLGWTRYLPADQAAAEVLRIVSDTVIEANDSGGIDLNDLVTRLEQAGYPLPDDDTA